MPHLSLSLLGTFQAALDGEPVTRFESNKVRALLAYLAVEADHSHSRDKLAGLLWPDFDEHAALGNLRNALANLRKSIGDRDAYPPFLLITKDTIQFNPASSYELDIHGFLEGIRSDPIEIVRQTIARYRGAFLEGFAVADGPAFEEWVLLKREQFQRLMLKALRRLADHSERCGDYEQAQHFARQQAALEPWQEEGHQQLMRCLALNGQRTAALAQYETCRHLLADELGVEPSAETTALYQSIRDETLVAPAPLPLLPAFLDLQAQAFDAERPLFVAREAELARLDRFLQRMLAGHGQVVFITGEPGSGKTLLMQEFTRRALIASPELVVVSGNCNAYTGIGDPYLPFLEMLDMLTGDVEVKWAGGAITREHASRLWALLPDAVSALVDSGSELIDRFVSGASLLARARVAAPSQVERLGNLIQRKAATVEPPGGQQTDLFEQYTTVLQTLARRHPLLLIADDLQWADVGSISLLFHLGRRLAGQRILILGAYRPGEVAEGRNGERHPLEPVVNEFQRDYGDIPVDLSQAEGRQFVDTLLNSEPNCLGIEFRETLYHHTGGHPLFTVELLRGLQRRGDLTKDAAGRWIEGAVLDWGTLPPRVEAVIAESVSRLPEFLRQMLIVASVEGEFFTAQAVAQVQAINEQEIIQRLSGPLSKQYRFVSAVGVQRSDGRQLARYRFRHFLFQRYLYSRLDEVERVRLHEAMGQALEMLYGEESPELAVQLARHSEAAGLIPRAVVYLHQAGDRAVRLFANAEGISLYRHALDLLNTLPDTPERAGQELRLRVALRIPLESVYGYTGDELEQNNVRLRDLIQHADVSPDLFWALLGLAVFRNLSLSLNEAHRLGDELLALAQRLEDSALVLGACHTRSITAVYEGQFEAYFRYRKQVHRLYDPEQHRPLVFQLDVDVEVGSLSHAAWAYWISGYPDQARQHAQAALDWANQLKHPFSLALACFFAGLVYRWCRDVAMTYALAEQTIASSREPGLSFWLASGGLLLGWTLGEQGRVVEGVTQLEQIIAALTTTDSELARVMAIPMLADMYDRAGRPAEGLPLVEVGLRVALATGFAMMEPDLYRCKGDLLLANASPEHEPEACFQQAIASARRIEAKSWELRAALSLCRLWQRQGKAGSARVLLSSIYGWFTEGFDTPDLQEARLLLQELAQQSSNDG